jgi:malate synthase
VLAEEIAKIESNLGSEKFRRGQYADAARLFGDLTTNDQFVEFLTLPGYEQLT